ncbi:hypothetical protein [Bacillus sp. T33-2]|uniref:hypothetical protein n=1 Tax=Bacillus sp. T33-2 TaxID=2054168 RepID=UPI000C769E8D|nr:hypothetical protein [Bacillus sp. T33-2]PLR96597.1 hypothetical protein CVD19_11470 [Bacillus sp. T33-2]
MRLILKIASFAAAAAVLLYLYHRQLGAVSFFILSIFFFTLSVNLMSREKKLKQDQGDANTDTYEKTGRNNRLN